MLQSNINPAVGDVVVSCSWDIANNRSINDTVTLSTTPQNVRDDLGDIVSLETCVHLTHPDTAPCALKLKLNLMKALQIKKIALVSEARIIEIYGKCEEYITTCPAEFFDECEDMSVYVAKAAVPQGSSECTLKFARLKKKGQMWLYGIHLTVEKVEPFTTSHTSVNFQNVNRILKDSGHQLTEKAEKCKKFLQLYGSFLDPNRTQVKGPDPQILMKMFEAEYLTQQTPFSSRAKSVSKCLTDILPGFSVPVKEKSSNEDGDSHAEEAAEVPLKLTPVVDSLKHHIDTRLSEYEKQTTAIVEEKLKELERKQNSKLDLILSQLNDLKRSLDVRGPEG